jgi:hypothetical protein
MVIKDIKEYIHLCMLFVDDVVLVGENKIDARRWK